MPPHWFLAAPLFFPYINATLSGWLGGIVSPGIKQSSIPKHAYTYISVTHYYLIKPHSYKDISLKSYHDILNLIKLPLKTIPHHPEWPTSQSNLKMVGSLSLALKSSTKEQKSKLKCIESQTILACSYIFIVILINAIKILY